MPKVVDHEERRRELADATLRLIAEVGVNAVTVRTVAEASGWSTGVLTHYFNSRHGLLVGALRRAAELMHARHMRHSEIAHSPSATDALRKLIRGALPIDPEHMAWARIFLFFYSEAATDDAAREEVSGYLAFWRKTVKNVLDLVDSERGLGPRDNTTRAIRLVSLLDGVGNMAVVDEELLTYLRADADSFIEDVVADLGYARADFTPHAS